IAGGSSFNPVSGGGAILGSAELYNPGSGSFNVTGSLTTARYGHTATLLNNGLVLIAAGSTSGYGSNATGTASEELYNPTSGAFISGGSLNAARYGNTATLLNSGLVVLAGGLGRCGD